MEIQTQIQSSHGRPDGLLEDAPLGEAIRAKCPSCEKLYMVDRQEIQSLEPRFSCSGCQSLFAFRLPIPLGQDLAETFLLRLPTEPIEVKTRQLPSHWITCPKCENPNPADLKECRTCGVHFSKYRHLQEERVEGEIQLQGRRELALLWQDVASNYQDESKHEHFLLQCLDTNCLPFASQKYARILRANAEDEIAKKMRKRIVALASNKIQSRIFPAKFKYPSFNLLLIFVGTLAFLVGLFMPTMKNLTGLGASTLALAAGLRWYLRKPV